MILFKKVLGLFSKVQKHKQREVGGWGWSLKHIKNRLLRGRSIEAAKWSTIAGTVRCVCIARLYCIYKCVFFCNVILWNKLLASISDQFNFCCCLKRWCCYVTKLKENTDIIESWNWVLSSSIYFKSLCPALRFSLAWAGYLYHHTLLQVALVQQSHTWNLALKAYRSILQQTIIWHRQRVCSK